MKCRRRSVCEWFWTRPGTARTMKEPPPTWRLAMGLAPALAISAAVAEHLSTTEGERGLYAEIVATDPRLCFAVESLLREHAELRRALDRSLDDRAAAELAALFHRHLRRGTDLVHEAYVADIGGEH